MRNTGILLALILVTVATSGCCQTCRNFFRRGAPCGTATLAPPMMGAPRPLGTPYMAAPQPMQTVGPPMQMVMPQQGGCCCGQAAPCCQPCQPCCEPCPAPCCEPCPTNCIPMGANYMGADCGCNGEMVGEGEWFGGYVEGSGPPPGTYVPQGAGTGGGYPADPGPVGNQ